MSINTRQASTSTACTAHALSDTFIQTVGSNTPEAYSSEKPKAQEEVGTVQDGYVLGNIVGSCSQVFNSSLVLIGNTKATQEARLALNAFKEKVKKTQQAPPFYKKTLPQETVKPTAILPPSLRMDLWRFGKSAEKEQRAEEKYLTHFNGEEKLFLRQQLGKVGNHFTTFEKYQCAKKLREPFEMRLLADDPPPPSKQRLESLQEEGQYLEQEIADLNDEIRALKIKLDFQSAAVLTSRRSARKNILQTKIDHLREKCELKQQLVVEKKELLLKKREQLLQANSDSHKSWTPLTQFTKDSAKRNEIYRIPVKDGEGEAIAQLKEIGILRRQLNKMERENQKSIDSEILHKLTQKLLKLVQKMGNFEKEIPSQEAFWGIEKLKKTLSKIYQRCFLQGREAPSLHKKRKKDEILTAFKDKFGQRRFAEVSNDLRSFLQETLFSTYPLETIRPEADRNEIQEKKWDLSECKVSELPFFPKSLLEVTSKLEIDKWKASHTLAVDTYLKNRLPFALINLLQIDSSASLARLFPGKKMGASQVKFFFGTLHQAMAHYHPTSVTKISEGSSEFYLFETFRDRKVQAIGSQQKKEQTHFYNYYILIFDVPSIQSLEHQLYQLRYADVPVRDMATQGNVETYNDHQVNALALKAKECLESADKTYGPALRVLLLGNTRNMLTEFAQYLQPGMNKDEAFNTLSLQYITPENPVFDLNHVRVTIPNPGKNPIPVALLALRMPNGSLAGKVTRAMFKQAKIEYLVTVGAGGSMNHRTPIGGYEFIDKSYIYDRQSHPFLKDTNLHQAFKKGHVLVPPHETPNTNITVSGPLLESNDWVVHTKKNLPSISNVDVESFHILNAFNQAPGDGVYPYITPALFISDHVGKKDSSLSKIIGKAAYKKAYLLVQFVAEQVRKLRSPASKEIPVSSPFKLEHYFLKTKTLYTSPGEKNPKVVQVPIANIGHIAFKKENLGILFQCINAVSVNRPYDSSATQATELPYFCEKTKLTAYRPHHNGTHSSRQARLVEAVLPYIAKLGKSRMKDSLNALFSSQKNILALQLAAYCLRIGRCDESGWKLDGDNYNARSAEVFCEYASQLKIDPKTTALLAKYIRLSTFDDNQAEIHNEQDRLVHAVLSLVHELDLIRLFTADKFKNKIHKHLKTLLREDTNIETETNALIKFSQNLCIATGGTLRNARSLLQNEEEFSMNSVFGDYCWKTVQNVLLPRKLKL